jgi:superfamily II DNA/RNA helicase
MSFEKLKIQQNIVRALKDMGIEEPTVIQDKAIPMIKSGKDVIGMSRTGSGKTVAFGVPLLEKIVPRDGVQALIIAPTRELAVQIAQELKKFGKYMKLSVATVYGGVSINPQMDRISRSEIVVGTPGRLLDHLRRNTLDLSGLKIVVLDEADKMVEMGFIEDIEQIIDLAPKNRQVLLFGATISEEINRLKRRYMKEPMVARAETHVTRDLLKQFYYDVKSHEKFSLLVHLLKKENTGRVMIFCSTRSTVEILTRNLQAQGVHAAMMHGKMTQNKRLQVIEQFHKGKPNVLVASAVAARGLDIKDVTHIFNYDLSKDPQEYIHRVGRTARAGEAGKAITLLSDKDYDAFSNILNRHRIEIKELPHEDYPRLKFQARQHDRFGRGPPRRHNRRGSGRFESKPRRSWNKR